MYATVLALRQGISLLAVNDFHVRPRPGLYTVWDMYAFTETPLEAVVVRQGQEKLEVFFLAAVEIRKTPFPVIILYRL